MWLLLGGIAAGVFLLLTAMHQLRAWSDSTLQAAQCQLSAAEVVSKQSAILAQANQLERSTARETAQLREWTEKLSSDMTKMVDAMIRQQETTESLVQAFVQARVLEGSVGEQVGERSRTKHRPRRLSSDEIPPTPPVSVLLGDPT